MSNERLEGLGPTSVWDRKIQGAGHKNQPVIKKKTALCSSAHFTYPHPFVWLCSFSQPTPFFFFVSLSLHAAILKLVFSSPRRAIPTTSPLLTFQWVLSDWRVTWRRQPSSWRPSALMQGRCSGPVTWSATWAQRETGKCQRYKHVLAI